MTYLSTGPDGETELPAPVRIRLDRDADAPADAFEGVFPLPSGCGAMIGLTVRSENGTVLFDGIIDEQETEPTGGTLSIFARSRAALLLDNEAMPQNYINPSLRIIFERHIRPYGFTRCVGDTRGFSGALTVSKGMSEWAVAEAFCSRFLGTKPRITENGSFDASGAVPEREILFGKDGIRFCSCTRKDQYCDLYSEIYTRTPGSGAYTLAARDAKAVSLGIVRRRFLSGGTNAGTALKKAGRSAFSVVLDCPGKIFVPLLSPARVSGLPGQETGLYVSSAHCRSGAGGEHTLITLRRE